MSYIYNDEDNVAMNDDFLGYHNPTVYLSRADMEYYESGQAERDREDMESAKEYRESQIREGFLDDLEIERGSKCRECPWLKECVIEAYEDQVDDDLIMPGEAYDLAKGICRTCMANPDRKDEAIEKYLEWWEAGEV